MSEKTYNSYRHSRTFRKTEKIREDISALKSEIEKISASLSIRELLVDLLSDGRQKKTGEWLYDLEALLGEAESAYFKLGRLKEELYYLEAELGEAKCMICF